MTVVPFAKPSDHAEWHARIGKVHLKGRENVVGAGIVTNLNIDPSRVLAAALEEGLSDVVVLGYNTDGNEYFASSIADGGTTLWLIEQGKKALLNVSMPERSSGIPA